MQAATELRQDLVLLGGGHSHALALRMLAMSPLAGLRITLVSLDSHTPYSGMLPGLVAGHYSFEDTHIDLARLCQWAGARFIAAEVTGLDPVARRVALAGRPDIAYDLVSIDVGAQPELDSVPGARDHVVPVKPVAALWRRWSGLQSRVDSLRGNGQYRVGVVGGGAGSVELVLAMAHRLRGSQVRFELWCGAPEILQNYNSRARRAVQAALQRSGIDVHLDARVAAVAAGSLTLADGRSAAFDELFWCTGAAAAPWLAASGLPVDGAGFLVVSDTLQSTADPRVFAAGDIATQVSHPRPKAGVFAVRQAPVLAHNLRASLLGTPLREHRPQRRFLSLVSLGDKSATADRGPFSASGKWVWRWKDRIDRRFMARFSALPPMAGGAQPLPELRAAQAQPHCGGCGAKVGADALSAALHNLRDAWPGYCAGDGGDAVMVPPGGGNGIAQSVDLLRQLVSDPWLMGRIAATHALSDLYASGARPLSALAVVILPYAGERLLRRELEQLLAGALHEFAAAGCRLNGGHSMQGPELAIGFVVNGEPALPNGALLAKRGARDGDCLLLTGALGTGVIFAAQMALAADGRHVDAALAAMLQGNGPAMETALAAGVNACTDVTGFGLVGHLREMLGGEAGGEAGGELGARLYVDRLPLLPGARDYWRRGITSTMHAANRDAAGPFLLEEDSIDEAQRASLFDPQTCGGLLLAVPPARAGDLRDALQARGYGATAIIGEVMRVSPEAARQVRLSLWGSCP